MDKTQINMRVDSGLLTFFKTQSEIHELTQVEYFEKILKDMSEGKTLEFLNARLEAKELEIIKLNLIIERFEKLTGKKMPKLRRVTFEISDKEFQDITNLSHQTQIAKKHLFSKFFTKFHSKNNLPELENIKK